MNRLWVRISLVIAFVALLITLSPIVIHEFFLERQNEGNWEPPPELAGQISDEDIYAYWDEVSRRAWISTITTVAVGALFSVGVGVWLSRSLLKPVYELERGARAVAAHNLAYRVPEEGSAELQSLAAAFNEMAAELEASETLRRNMLADVSHELRHPVQVLRGNLQGILDGIFPLSQEEIAFLSEQTLHLSQLVTDLHDLALAEAHELPLFPQQVALDRLTQDAVDAVLPLALEKEIALVDEVPEEPLWGWADPGRLRQAIRNLLSNAIRYTPAGGQVTVRVCAERQPAGIAISVSDTGMGITAEELPFVFDRFYRSDASRNRHDGGAGLGLAITKAIVEAHEGQITVESTGRERGSTFTIHLPLV